MEAERFNGLLKTFSSGQRKQEGAYHEKSTDSKIEEVIMNNLKFRETQEF